MTLYESTIGLFLEGVNGTIDATKDLFNGVPNGILKPTPRTTDVKKSAENVINDVKNSPISKGIGVLTSNFSAILAIGILAIIAYIVSKIGGGK